VIKACNHSPHIKIIRQNGDEMLKAQTSTIISNKHGFFGRNGGVSEGIYASLNASYGSKDSPANIDENRARIADYFGVQPSHLLTLNQTHSNICLIVGSPYDSRQAKSADALATKTVGLVLGVLTADCVPILLEDKAAGVVAAAHAGWKGALAGIVENTIKAMIELGANPENIAACMGASIAACSYEVENEFANQYLSENPTWQKFFTPTGSTHLLFDNKAFVAEKLRGCGVQNIEVMPNDTYAEAEEFFSFRRATHAGESDYGRQISAITIAP
jgi:YfiH family protein